MFICHNKKERIRKISKKSRNLYKKGLCLLKHYRQTEGQNKVYTSAYIICHKNLLAVYLEKQSRKSRFSYSRLTDGQTNRIFSHYHYDCIVLGDLTVFFLPRC